MPVIIPVGLALADSPDVAHHLTFLMPLVDQNNIGTGLAVTLVPALMAILFASIGVFIVHRESLFLKPSTSRLIVCRSSKTQRITFTDYDGHNRVPRNLFLAVFCLQRSRGHCWFDYLQPASL